MRRCGQTTGNRQLGCGQAVSLRLVFARCLLIPLLALAAIGTEAGSRALLEEEPAVATSSAHVGVGQVRSVNAAAEERGRPRIPEGALRNLKSALNRPVMAIAPHGRPDNTRGDPVRADHLDIAC